MDSCSVNFAGSSVVADKVIATFTASYNGNPDIYIGISVVDHELMAANKDAVDEDLAAFNSEVLEAIDTLTI